MTDELPDFANDRPLTPDDSDLELLIPDSLGDGDDSDFIESFKSEYHDFVTSLEDLLAGWREHPDVHQEFQDVSVGADDADEKLPIGTLFDAAICADMMRIAFNAITAEVDDSNQDKATPASFAAAPREALATVGSEFVFRKLAGKIGEVRPQYAAYCDLDRDQIPELLKMYGNDSGPFGFLDSSNEWRGHRLCRHLSVEVQQPSNDQAESLLQSFCFCAFQLSIKLCEIRPSVFDLSRTVCVALGEVGWMRFLDQLPFSDSSHARDLVKRLLYHYPQQQHVILPRLDEIIRIGLPTTERSGPDALASVLAVRCQWFAEHDRTDDAERDFQEVLKLWPEIEDDDFWSEFARMRARAGNRSMWKAFRLAKQAVSMSSHRRAINNLQRAVHLAPEVSWLNDTLAWTIVSGPDATPAECEQALAIAARQGRGETAIKHRRLCSLAAVHARQGNFKDAVEVIDQAIEAVPEYEIDQLHRAPMYSRDRQLFLAEKCYDPFLDEDTPWHLQSLHYVFRAQLHPLTLMSGLDQKPSGSSLIARLWHSVMRSKASST